MRICVGMRRVQAAAAAIALAVGSSVTLATAVTEPPDLSNLFATPTALPAFTVGTNTVSGTVDFAAGDVYDIFMISLAPGATLSSVSVTISNYVSQGPPASGPGHGSFSMPLPTNSGVGNNGSGNGTYPFSAIYPVSLGYSYFGSAAGQLGNGFAVSQLTSSRYSYEWSFVVVPAPGCAGALGLACAGLAARRRR